MNRILEKRAERNAATFVGIVYICAWCQRVKNPDMEAHHKEAWHERNEDCCTHGVPVSHGICPECKARLMPLQKN